MDKAKKNQARADELVAVNNITKAKISQKLIKNIAFNFLSLFGINQPVSIAIVGDRTIRRLNRQYRGRDKVTDVLAFLGDDDFFGEIIIDYAQIKRQAKRLRKTITAELAFVLIHGLLHLAGFRDDTEVGKKQMLKKGEEIMAIMKAKGILP